MNHPQESDAPHETPPEFWRSIAELEGEPEFLEAVEGEFPGMLQFWNDPTTRRKFLHRMAASMSLAGLCGCPRQPQEEIVPPVETLSTYKPGETRHFATSMPLPGGAIGLLATSRDGRPIKLEGNPQHPSSLGATDILSQASILDLYDPDRSDVVRHQNRLSNWPEFVAALKTQLEQRREQKGGGLHLLTRNVTSPTLLRQLQQLFEELPDARWYEHDVHDEQSIREGTRQAFGQGLSPRYAMSQADVIFSLDADFLNSGPSRVRLAKEFSARRRVPASGKANFNRLYVAECTPTLTGASADHRLPVSTFECAALLGTVARELGVEVEDAGETGLPKDWISAVVSDLTQAGQRALVMVGPAQPAELHALAFAINTKLGCVGRTIDFISPIDRWGDRQPGTLADLANAIDEEQVETLLILDANPSFTAPHDLKFDERLGQVPFSVHLGLYRDETAQLCDWHIPLTHYLESWSDEAGADGTAGIVQPLIAPLLNGHSLHQIVNLLLGKQDQSDYDTVRETWKGQLGDQTKWNRAVHDGVMADTRSPAVEVKLRDDYQPAFPDAEASPKPGSSTDNFEIHFRPDPSVLDGRYANNGWLQELPRPFSRLTWTNAAYISPETAEELGLGDGDVIELSSNENQIRLPIFRVPGQPRNSTTVYLGYGRTTAGRNGTGAGVDVYPLRTTASPWRAVGNLRKTGEHIDMPTTQNHFLMEGRGLVKRGTWEEFQQNPDQPAFMSKDEEVEKQYESPEGPPTLYPPYPQEGPQWGMTINLGACIGCNACTIACQAENNIPVVGSEEVLRGREMHWIRVDTYYSGETENPDVDHQPVPCMQCEHAPCEPVCPVGATTHSPEGLNDMTYNRCIGTRYCSNNCPYKVRRFNFFDYREEVMQSPLLQLLPNPEVTVRTRGVMEKCTYCVQRINAARITASMEDDREIRDGEIVTACQAVCPTDAIVFGNKADPDSRVSEQKSHPLNYGILEELNTRPRTTYLASVVNPSAGLNTQGGDR